ncbi:hypothetical protein J3D54_005161 [Pseudomonas sp. GGS8]|uniref:cellulose biosynthesis cyclic di-GMP-binding regulatory protein BcsB n=1 Tax=Pseudomonas sp. GGS8 TaxID=2817892 RepID=UPI00209D5043|nr:cellulose biosynthesis cyclic di-GMP-binding regulatory protein BcsB [Pseudomonas sp. GGS8]MCP1446029.1 hypothetical protein [Pseudomonas sp. GGS8]
MTRKYFARNERHFSRDALTALALSVLCLGASFPAFAATQTATSQIANTGYHLPLNQPGNAHWVNLNRATPSDTMRFNIRADEVVSQARLTLHYSYSSAGVGTPPQINVLMNNQVVTSLPLAGDSSRNQHTQVIDLPAQFITDYNQLTLQLIEHDIPQSDPSQPTHLWARIINTSYLDLNVMPITLPDDLAILPEPFFDRRDTRRLVLPFVFATAADQTTLEAAGAISSWFGAQAGSREAMFPSSFNELPKQGNAIVLVNGSNAPILSDLKVPHPKNATLSLITNPNDPYGKLLIIAGRNAEELKRATMALVIGSQTLSGNRATIAHLDPAPSRQPFDAPNWIPSDRPVRLDELVNPKMLKASAHNQGSIDVALRRAPDLFGWRQSGVPLNLKYRYSAPSIPRNASINVSLNDTYITSVPITPNIEMGILDHLYALLKNNKNQTVNSHILLPLDAIPTHSSLKLHFSCDDLIQIECRNFTFDNAQAAVEPDSTLDFSHYEHFIAMPDLGVFKGSGFPFTQMADLSESAIVLPDKFGTAEVSAYLNVLGHFGRITGYPALAVTVVQAQQIDKLYDKDLLILASGANQPLLEHWADLLPSDQVQTAPQFEFSSLLSTLRNWINFRSTRYINLEHLETDGCTYLSGFESPLSRGRSAVVISGCHQDALAEATATLITGELNDQSIQGSLVAIKERHAQVMATKQTYYAGHLPPFKLAQRFLSLHLGWLLLITTLATLLFSVLTYLSLSARAQQRLGN